MTFDDLAFSGPYRIAELRFITDDGGYHREVRSPGDDLSDLPAEVQTTIEAEWTPAVIADYQAALASQPDPPSAAEKLRQANFLADLARIEYVGHLRDDPLPADIETFVRTRLGAAGLGGLPEIRDYCERVEDAFVALLKALALHVNR